MEAGICNHLQLVASVNRHLIELVAMPAMVNWLTEAGVLKVLVSINQFKKKQS